MLDVFHSPTPALIEFISVIAAKSEGRVFSSSRPVPNVSDPPKNKTELVFKSEDIVNLLPKELMLYKELNEILFHCVRFFKSYKLAFGVFSYPSNLLLT